MLTSRNEKEKKYHSRFSFAQIYEPFVFLRQRRFLNKHSGRGVDRFYIRRIFHQRFYIPRRVTARISRGRFRRIPGVRVVTARGRKREIKWLRQFWHLTIQLVRFSPSFGHFVYAGILKSPVLFFFLSLTFSCLFCFKWRLAASGVVQITDGDRGRNLPRAGEESAETDRKREGTIYIYIYFLYVMISAIVIILPYIVRHA